MLWWFYIFRSLVIAGQSPTSLGCMGSVTDFSQQDLCHADLFISPTASVDYRWNELSSLHRGVYEAAHTACTLLRNLARQKYLDIKLLTACDSGLLAFSKKKKKSLHVVAEDQWLCIKNRSCLNVLTGGCCCCLALCLRAVDSSSTMTGSDSPWEPGSLWSCPCGAPHRTGRRRRASFVWWGRHLPHQYLCCPTNVEREEWLRTLCMHLLS